MFLRLRNQPALKNKNNEQRPPGNPSMWLPPGGFPASEGACLRSHMQQKKFTSCVCLLKIDRALSTLPTTLCLKRCPFTR